MDRYIHLHRYRFYNIAKQNNGVFNISGHEDRILQKLLTSDIWGISKGLSGQLKKLGIETALELKNTKQMSFGVVLKRIMYELKGVSCLKLEEVTLKKNIMSSRSFCSNITKIEDLEEAISNYVSRACEKLRKQGCKAQGMYIYLKSNKFTKYSSLYHNSTFIGFDVPLCDTGKMIQIAKRGIKSIYKDGYAYKKAGVMLSDIILSGKEQQSFFAKNQTNDDLMKTLDHINKKIGNVFYLAQGIDRSWEMRSDKKSPRYTTNWNEVLQVY